MHLKYRNINDAFSGLVRDLHSGKIPTNVVPSRVGEVAMIEEPVIITYDQPRERVLLNSARECNPFFHLYESLWMLSGRNDVAPLTYYNGKIAEIASDDGKTFNGAYGYRWHGHDTGQNQLDEIVRQLKADPYSRRCVLQMWTPWQDLFRQTKDKCCNLSACFIIEDERYLNMTVFNRSNDLVWGALGANVVHFSFLQEYLACRIGLEVGRYNQASNNLHYYTERWEPEKWIADYELAGSSVDDYPYSLGPLLVENPSTFDEDCARFVHANSDFMNLANSSIDWGQEFLTWVAQPMCNAFHYHKQRNYHAALQCIEKVLAEDWQVAGEIWLLKREAQWESKRASTSNN